MFKKLSSIKQHDRMFSHEETLKYEFSQPSFINPMRIPMKPRTELYRHSLPPRAKRLSKPLPPLPLRPKSLQDFSAQDVLNPLREVARSSLISLQFVSASIKKTELRFQIKRIAEIFAFDLVYLVQVSVKAMRDSNGNVSADLLLYHQKDSSWVALPLELPVQAYIPFLSRSGWEKHSNDTLPRLCSCGTLCSHRVFKFGLSRIYGSETLYYNPEESETALIISCFSFSNMVLPDIPTLSQEMETLVEALLAARAHICIGTTDPSLKKSATHVLENSSSSD